MELSVIIPVYNEELSLPALFARLYPALDKLALTYEIIFINDGSRDRSAAVLRQQFEMRPDVTRVVLLAGNYGQHMAIMAGFEQSRGNTVVTLDGRRVLMTAFGAWNMVGKPSNHALDRRAPWCMHGIQNSFPRYCSNCVKAD